MTRNTLQFLTKGLTSDKAKQIVSKVYTSLEDTGVGLEIWGILELEKLLRILMKF
jgi:uncharacterized protein (UPF0297 family)